MRILNKTAASVIGVGSLFVSLQASAAEQACAIRFKLDSIEYNQGDLEKCKTKLRTEGTREIYVLGSATPQGSKAYNADLAERRAKALGLALGPSFPGVEINTLAVGEDAQLGLSARVVAATEEGEDLAASAQAASEAKAADEGTRVAGLGTANAPAGAETSVRNIEQVYDKSWRAALRVSQDNYRPEDHNYAGAGVEVAWFRNKSLFDQLRVEVGGGLNGYTSSAHPNAFAMHGFVGPGYQLDRVIPGIVVGGRAMVGGAWDESRKWRLDPGLEGRVGYENSGFSVFAGLGQTKEFTRLGLDVGMAL